MDLRQMAWNECMTWTRLWMLLGFMFLGLPGLQQLALQAFRDSDSGLVDCDSQLGTKAFYASSDNGLSYHSGSCMLHPYTKRPSDVRACLSMMNYNNASLFFVGDSIARRLFLATKVALGDAQEADFEKMDGVLRDSQDEDISHTTLDGVTIAFRWDPFLNTTSYRDRRVFPVVSAGFWHSQHFGEDPATAFGHFQQSVHALLNHWDRSFSDSDATNPFLLRLVSPVVHAKLSPNRQETFREKNLEEYNRFIRDFSALHSLESHSSSSTSLPLASEALHAVFMNHPDLAPRTEDGFQYDYSVTSTELNVLLNGICNEKLFNGLNSKRKVTACCHSGPKLKSKNYFFMGSLILYAVSCLIWRSLDCTSPRWLWIPSQAQSQNLLIFTTTLILMATSDRSPLFLKIDKVFSWQPFGFLMALVVAGGLGTLTVQKDSSFLNRHQTEEWKGWMQLCILVYHYTGASKVSIIYNAIRVLVAAYIFMTGYGHFTYFYKKNDFSLARVSKVLLRLNLLTAAMSYVMDQPLPFYYFAPLVSFWFLVIFGLMSVCKDSKGNHNAVLLKSLLCGATTRLFIHSPICLGMLFDLTQKLLKTDQWNAKEFGFRLALDEWVVYLGTAMAFASIWITRYLGSVPLSTPSNFSPLARMAIVDPIHWRKLKGLVLLVSAVSVLFFIFVNMSVQDKFEYNRLHPWLSLFPVGGFVVLRNSTETLRRTTSTFWKWVGGFSLESFLLQYHLWLAADTKGLLVVLPFSGLQPYSIPYWLNFTITTIIFLGLSETMSRVTGDLVNSLSPLRTLACLIFLILWNYI